MTQFHISLSKVNLHRFSSNLAQVILTQCSFIFSHRKVNAHLRCNFHTRKLERPARASRVIPVSLEPMPKVAEGGRINVRNIGYHVWKVSGSQSCRRPITFSGGMSWHRGLQNNIWKQPVCIRALSFIADVC